MHSPRQPSPRGSLDGNGHNAPDIFSVGRKNGQGTSTSTLLAIVQKTPTTDNKALRPPLCSFRLPDLGSERLTRSTITVPILLRSYTESAHAFQNAQRCRLRHRR